MGGHVARMEEDRSAFKILTGKPTDKRPLGRPKRKWEENIKIDLKVTVVCMSIWFSFGKDREYCIVLYWNCLISHGVNYVWYFFALHSIN